MNFFLFNKKHRHFFTHSLPDLKKISRLHKRFFLFFLTICLLLGNFLFFCPKNVYGAAQQLSTSTVSADASSADDAPSGLYAKAALLMDGSNQRILFEKDGEKELPMASTTKIMTCLYALEHGNLQDKITFSENAASAPKVHLGAKAGDQFLLSDLLYALMLESYNDVAVAIAEHIGGSVEAFCQAMTQEARDYGCYHTSFETPNGLDSENHYTTCRDLATLTCLALKNENFCKIIQESSFTIKEINSGSAYSLQNKNAFLSSYEGAIGVKTGYTSGAGYCFVGAVKKDGHYLISVVLGSGWYPNRSYKWADTKKLMDYGLNNFQEKEIALDQGIPATLPVTSGRKGICAITAPESVSLFLGSSEKTSCTVSLPESLAAPLEKGAAVGSVTLLIDGKEYRSYPIYASESIKKRTFSWCYEKVLEKCLKMY